MSIKEIAYDIIDNLTEEQLGAFVEVDEMMRDILS